MRRKLAQYGVPFTAIGTPMEGDDLKVNLLPRGTLNDLYQAVDLTLLTSRWEGGPYAILEAAGTRCKVLSTRVGLAEDVLEPESLFDDIPAAIAAVRLDIERGALARSRLGSTKCVRCPASNVAERSTASRDGRVPAACSGASRSRRCSMPQV